MHFFSAKHTECRVRDFEPMWDWSSTTLTHTRIQRFPWRETFADRALSRGQVCGAWGTVTSLGPHFPCSSTRCQNHKDVRWPQPVFQLSQAPTLPSASIFPSSGWESACKQAGGVMLQHSCLLQLHPMVFLQFTHLDATLLPSKHNSQCKEQASIQNPIPWLGNHHQFAMLTTKINSLVSSTTHSFNTLSSPGKSSK